MPLAISPFLRRILLTDATLTAAAALLLLLGAGILEPLLGLPRALMFWAGVILAPFVALLLVVARRQRAPRLLLLDIVIVNALWVIASFVLLVLGNIAPTLLGVAFIVVQALAVGLLALLQLACLRSLPREKLAI